MNDGPNNAGLSPLAILARLRAVHSDKDLTHSERIAVAGVIFHANKKTGIGWPGYRHLMKEHQLSPTTIRSALRKAIGRHLEPAGLGPWGTQAYRVLAVEVGEEGTTRE
jgi:hypothetical protein